MYSHFESLLAGLRQLGAELRERRQASEGLEAALAISKVLDWNFDQIDIVPLDEAITEAERLQNLRRLAAAEDALLLRAALVLDLRRALKKPSSAEMWADVDDVLQVGISCKHPANLLQISCKYPVNIL